MSPLSVPNFSPIGARIRVLWRILQNVRKEVEEKKPGLSSTGNLCAGGGRQGQSIKPGGKNIYIYIYI